MSLSYILPRLKPNKKSIFSALICLAVLFFSKCISDDSNDPRGQEYAGSASCIKCHADIAGSYLHTAHFRSVTPGTQASIQGSFAGDSNIFVVSSTKKIIMQKRDGGLYQVYYKEGRETEAHRFDIVFGSVKGETYLYWQNNKLYQLPVSYSNELHAWTTSPGFAGHKTEFSRQINERCFECHSSYIQQSDRPADGRADDIQLNRSNAIYNIDCERCHGPASTNVAYQSANPNVKEAKYITSYRSLSRSQKIDMCAQCHSGMGDIKLQPLFGFRPGDTLARFTLPRRYNDNYDVHGNQSQLLARSQCFIHTTMDCVTCHNTHENQRSNITLFNRRCQTCHQAAMHPSLTKDKTEETTQLISSNCITCHMPLQSSGKIVLETSGSKSSAPVKVITHLIAIYADETNKVLKRSQP